jgi:hypothetical protein
LTLTVANRSSDLLKRALKLAYFSGRGVVDLHPLHV